MHFPDRRTFLKSTSAALLGGAFGGRVMGQAQTLPEGWHLRVGRAQTPEEAREELAAFKAATPDLASWEKRKAAIRQGMLEAVRLTKLPEKPPLDPVYTNKRTYEGYTAESVHIRSWPGFYITGTLYRPLERETALCRRGVRAWPRRPLPAVAPDSLRGARAHGCRRVSL